ncbi:MAG: enoyl-CoA hydratase/isomerase family protein, partial [Pseudorhodobacter sp.]
MKRAVILERHDRVAVLRINRPEVRNAIDLAVADALVDHVQAVARDTNIGALVVCGDGGKAFSTGADLAT